MCLLEPKNSHIANKLLNKFIHQKGWKAIRVYKDQIRAIVMLQNTYPFNQWITAPFGHISCSPVYQPKQHYSAGFHVFINKNDAILLARSFPAETYIVEVEYKGIHTTGYESVRGKDAPTIVVQKVKFLKHSLLKINESVHPAPRQLLTAPYVTSEDLA